MVQSSGCIRLPETPLLEMPPLEVASLEMASLEMSQGIETTVVLWTHHWQAELLFLRTA